MPRLNDEKIQDILSDNNILTATKDNRENGYTTYAVKDNYKNLDSAPNAEWKNAAIVFFVSSNKPTRDESESLKTFLLKRDNKLVFCKKNNSKYERLTCIGNSIKRTPLSIEEIRNEIETISLKPKSSDSKSKRKNEACIESYQKIYFGAPGTGKSYKINELILNDVYLSGSKDDRKEAFKRSSFCKSSYDTYLNTYIPRYTENCNVYELNSVVELRKVYDRLKSVSRDQGFNENERKQAADSFSGLNSYIAFVKQEFSKDFVFRTTFHPDYDYAQFVGAYKPQMYWDEDLQKKKGPRAEQNKSLDQGKIAYAFVPQVFAKAYAAAWRMLLSNNGAGKVYLIIEEINRGNCAQIFGDIFQLLDRDDSGASQYSIDADNDFAKWLEGEFQAAKVWDAYKKKIGSNRKLKLPPNLIILATMNTSDQSLFPMDSAFKRRFDWSYVPIKYKKDKECGDEWKADEFVIEINNDLKYDWLDFLSNVNDDIENVTFSEDKKMGEFFVKPKDNKTIDFDVFRSKVLFYLWDSVYKDDEGSSKDNNVFHFEVNDPKGKTEKKKLTFQMLFEGDRDKQINLVNKIMEKLKVLSPDEANKKRNGDETAAKKNNPL